MARPHVASHTTTEFCVRTASVCTSGTSVRECRNHLSKCVCVCVWLVCVCVCVWLGGCVCVCVRERPRVGAPKVHALQKKDDTMAAAADNLWLLLCGAILMFMHVGFAMVECGTCRARNASDPSRVNRSLLLVFGVVFCASWRSHVGFLRMLSSRTC